MSCNVTSCETWTCSELWRSSRLTLFIYRRRMLRDKTGNGLNEKPSCCSLKLKFIETEWSWMQHEDSNKDLLDRRSRHLVYWAEETNQSNNDFIVLRQRGAKRVERSGSTPIKSWAPFWQETSSQPALISDCQAAAPAACTVVNSKHLRCFSVRFWGPLIILILWRGFQGSLKRF